MATDVIPPAAEPDDEEIAGIWRAYVADREGRPDLHNRLAEHYLPYVVEIAERMIRKLPGHVDVQDIVSAGNMGLLDAIARFRPELAIRFKTFSQQRIKGAIKDELRRNDWTPRTVRQLSNHLAHVRAEFESRFGRPPSDEEMAEQLHVELDEYHGMLRESQIRALVPLDRGNGGDSGKRELDPLEMLPDTRAVAPLDELIREEVKEQALRGLSEDERNVLLMYYERELSLKEIGLVLGKSESRVCQIHGNALAFLRQRHEQATTGVLARAGR